MGRHPGMKGKPSDPQPGDRLPRVSRASWDDLVLPDDTLGLVHQIADQYRERARVYEEWGFGEQMGRGLGITALFVGPPGTGKSLASAVIARELGIELHRIDLAAVVSRFVAETEKNLRHVFDAAEKRGALLFFDEADSLFGKRTEVRDSHDRYANIEIDHLLWRMESYPGIAILATNAHADLDAAFVRRVRFIVAFAIPGLEERREIWGKVFPPAAPLDALDFDRLVAIEVTGGVIRDIALNAAFRAAHQRTSITMDLVCAAARTELHKWGMAMPEACAETGRPSRPARSAR